MATLQEFGKRILQISGVRNYILVRNDGKLMVHNLENADAMASMVVFGGLSCDAIGSIGGLTYLKYLMLTRKNNEKLIIFPMDSYFLGIIQNPDAYTQDIVDHITRLIQIVVKPKKSS